jgi:hypothetical protein
MLKIIEETAGKGTPLCESIQRLYTLCEGMVRPRTQRSFDLLNQRYGEGGRPDPHKIAEAVELMVDNDQGLYNLMYTSRSPSHSVAWAAMMKAMNDFLDFQESAQLNSEQFKRWFADGGMDFKVGMQEAVAVIDAKRAERRAELAAQNGV